MSEPSTAHRTPHTEYRVLARKYRPSNFDELVGQEVLVQTLTNAFALNRIAHAFLLTGLRGIGKTTTARIIAKALNCEKGPSITPCSVCEHCKAIAESRHLDVLEMDAASRTGVDDIREIIDGVRYKPASARFKVYIIDEVHMLSKNAFNALLKTLEEPPESVKFIFATTEAHKLPVTVLSRCQRFDLRRLETEQLAQHLQNIAAKERTKLSPDAAKILAQAAEGSVRDGLSLLDQAIALLGAAIEADALRDMLGLADKSDIYKILDHVLAGRAAESLAQWQSMHQSGADAALMVQDLLSATHAISKTKIADFVDPTESPQIESMRRDMAQKLGIGNLSRLWQMLLKGASEVQQAGNPAIAFEMLLIRIAYAADLPLPQQVLESLQNSPPPQGGPPGGGRIIAQASSMGGGGSAAIAVAASPAAQNEPSMHITAFSGIVALCEEKREIGLHYDLYNNAHLVKFAPATAAQPGQIELRLTDKIRESNFAGKLSQKLHAWTGMRWMVSISQGEAQDSLAAQEKQRAEKLLAEMERHPQVRKALDIFPGAKIIHIRPPVKAAKADTAESEVFDIEEL